MHEPHLEKSTRAYFLVAKIFDGPLWSLYCGLLIWILVKQFEVTPIQITILMSARPTMALMSSYWSALAPRRSDRLKLNIIGIEALGKLPSLLFPFVGHTWFYIGAYAVYMMSVRGAIPAWLQVIKLNIPHRHRSVLFSNGFIMTYAIEIGIPITLAFFLDAHVAYWKWLFFIAGLLSFVSIFFNSRIPVSPRMSDPIDYPKDSLGTLIAKPWREAIHLFKKAPDFFKFEMMYFLGGFGFLMARRAIPEAAIHIPWISYGQLIMATSLCKGIGYLATSRLWANWLNHVNFYQYCALVFLFGACVPLIMLSAFILPLGLFVGYLFYGIMRGGDDLSWHLAAALFSGEGDSYPYSSASNILLGIRGLGGSFFGGYLVSSGKISLTFMVGSALIFFSAYWSLFTARSKNLRTIPSK